jgi:hypothetical protein
MPEWDWALVLAWEKVKVQGPGSASGLVEDLELALGSASASGSVEGRALESEWARVRTFPPAIHWVRSWRRHCHGSHRHNRRMQARC